MFKVDASLIGINEMFIVKTLLLCLFLTEIFNIFIFKTFCNTRSGRSFQYFYYSGTIFKTAAALNYRFWKKNYRAEHHIGAHNTYRRKSCGSGPKCD